MDNLFETYLSLYSINTNMQNLPVYLYSNTLDVTLDLDATVRGVNQVMYQRDLKIQKGIKKILERCLKEQPRERYPHMLEVKD